MIRQPIITVLGHVDHGKTTLLDYIRGTTLAQREAGKITQHIGATEVPIGTLQKVCGGLLEVFNLKFTIPGLLFIDTPGHEAFTNLRKRGGSIADLAVLIIDINQGIQPQTREAIQILKTFKVPFIVAATKIDMLMGWKARDKTFLVNLKQQSAQAKESYDKKFYKLLGELAEMGFDSNIYNQVDDYSKTIAIVPVSGHTGEGIAELLAILTGLAQKFLHDKLEVDIKKPAKGTILEIKEEKGMGTTADVIIYEGSMTKDDTIIVGGTDVFDTKIRSLLKPVPLAEIRDKKSSFKHVDRVVAAAGIKILAPDLDKALAGAPFASGRNEQEVEAAKRQILDEIEEVLVETADIGIILKADTLGSIEAAANLLNQKGLPIKRADIGNITKQDILEASSQKAEIGAGFVLGFNVKCSDGMQKEADKEKVPVICHPVIYKIVEEYEEQLEVLKKAKELEKLQGITWPGKFKIIPQYVFRQSNPAIFGVEVSAGKLKANTDIINQDGEIVGHIKSIEDSGKKLEELKQGEEAALSVKKMIIGRNVEPGEELYIDVPESSYKKLKEVKKLLTGPEKVVLKEIAEIHRRTKEIWGI
ncbi:translation initiation factor IF-2 [Candidatus Woesearchaeota archaeon]|nr:translation initiation factor IF-2 [Candidatus Woesearchaeota archaeon]